MLIKTEQLNSLLETLPPHVVGNFKNDYQDELDKNNRLYSKIYGEVLGKKNRFVFGQSRMFFKKYADLIERIKNCPNNVAKIALLENLGSFLKYYDEYFSKDYEKYLDEFQKLEDLGIDFISINPRMNNKFFRTSKTTTSDNYILNSLKIYSPAFIKDAVLQHQKANGTESVACFVKLEDPEFVLKKYPNMETENNVCNYLEIPTPDVDVSKIEKIDDLDDWKFDFSDELLKRVSDDAYKVVDLDDFQGKNPKVLYKKPRM